MRSGKCVAAAAIVALGASAVASAQAPIFTFGFNDLTGSYEFDGSAGQFDVEATALADGGPFDSSGDVTRVLPPDMTANFDPGFVTLGTAADVVVQMAITNVTSNTADGVGTFLITDANGDQISGDISGTWRRNGLFGSFAGVATEVMLDSLSGDGTFDGPSGGAFDLAFPGGPTYSGAILVLETGSWFSSDFSDADVQVTASIVPEPAGCAVMALAALALTRPRRSSNQF